MLFRSEAKIAIIPDEEIKKIITEFDPIKTYKVNGFIDLFDSGTWRSAVIQKMNANTMEVRYEGWGPKYDEKDLKIADYRVAPFRKHSIGYTGQAKQAYRSFKYYADTKTEHEAKLLELIKDPLSIKDPIEYNQLFRGTIFFYIDSILTLINVAKLTRESIKEILEFTKIYMKSLIEWIRISWDLVDEITTAVKWNHLYLVHTRTAVAMAYNEVASSLFMFFGGSIRSIESFLYLYANSQENNIGGKIDSKKAIEWCVDYFYKAFKELGGFDEILKMVKE